MTALVLSPHNDDAVLFSSFNAIRHQAHVITVFRSAKQEQHKIYWDVREAEDEAAFAELGIRSYEQWDFADTVEVASTLADALADRLATVEADHVFAPAVEEDGHDQHNLVGYVADFVFGRRGIPVTHYLTYRRHHGKSQDGVEVEPEREWVTRKLRALACYRTQIETAAAGCTAHFLREQREYVQP